MCLIFVALKSHPKYRVVVAANRDEFYNRRTAAADFWPDNKNILGGRDLQAGGTWLAVQKNGKLAMVTNYRDLRNIKQNAPSRGHLVTEYLTGSLSAEAFTQSLREKKHLFNGYNLIVGTPDELWYSSNYSEESVQLKKGIFGLSNHLLETPWPKVKNGKEKFRDVLKNESPTPEQFFEMLFDDRTAPDELLPDTGVGLQRERALSSMFIKSPGYGTRCSTVVLIDNNDNVSFTERVYDLNDFSYTSKSFTFQVEKTLSV